MQVTDLAHLNVTLNATAAVLLLVGFVAIKTDRKRLHIGCMCAALVVALAFFVSYGIYHYNVGSKKYEGTGAMRTLYFVILITHVTLAAINLPLVVMTATRAFRGRYEKHKRLARITWPVWMYVSVTGVIVYFMLY